MEQVFKTKWVPDWQYVGMGVAILVVIVVFFWLQEWTALGGLIVPLMLFYSQSKTIYTIKDSGVLEVKSVWGKDLNRKKVSCITKLIFRLLANL